jgi:two-component system NtrC family sensor kinase
MEAPNTRILIIDDNPSIHEDMRKILSAEEDVSLLELEADLFGESSAAPAPQYRIDSAFQGKEGLEKVCKALREQDPYAVAFVDVRMPPGWDGIETVEHIWKQYPELQVVLCTAYSDHSWSEIFTRLGRSDNLLILKKPFDPIELHQMASSLSRKWALQREDKKKLQLANDELTKTNALLEVRLRELRDAQLQLVQAEKLAAVGQLASGIAHEINTPIQFISSNVRFIQGAYRTVSTGLEPLRALLTLNPETREKFAEVTKRLQFDYLQEEIPPALQQSMEGLDRIHSIVGAMMEFAQPSQGQMAFIGAKKMIENTLAVSQHTWKDVADIEVDLDPNLEQIWCLRDELCQVLLTLLVNAAHAISDVVEGKSQRGKLTIKTRKQGAWAELSVSDTGVGIPKELQHRIFEPFFTTKEVGRGTGQGLAIAYSMIVGKHKGQITFASTPGEGSTFTVRIPQGNEKQPTTNGANVTPRIAL